MTNQAMRSTFLLAPTKRPIVGDLDHPAVRFMPKGSDLLQVEITGGELGVEIHRIHAKSFERAVETFCGTKW